MGCMVPLKTSGDRPPLLLFHPTPGDVMGYGNLVCHLGNDQPCYGFVARGLLKDGECHMLIEDMAEYYIEELLTNQIPESYFLAGWCYGGIVALEAAQQLRARGKKVAYLGMIDTMASAIRTRKVKQRIVELKNAFLSSQVPPGHLRNDTGGWDVAAGEVDVYNIDCRHEDILKEPVVTDLAEKLVESLARHQRQSHQ
ncbi:MAG: hypothetical protein CMO80_01915 [Verrucomicrobiales bacterium]|nr:hypothetical protein [Verrucomicrobiales bacterium]|tara:strand:+ start:69 stop:662 length:594 start_codon:yes stop_codon:yes gene_type:complete